jgi:hypothetical protein
MRKRLFASVVTALLFTGGAAAASTTTLATYIYTEASASDAFGFSFGDPTTTDYLRVSTGSAGSFSAGVTDPLSGYSATSFADFGVRRAFASIAAADPVVLAGQDLTSSLIQYGMGRTAGSTALTLDYFTPSADAHVTANIFYDRTVSATFAPDQQLVDDLAAAHDPNDPNVYTAATATADMTFYICDASIGCTDIKNVLFLTALNLASGHIGGFSVDDSSVYNGVSTVPQLPPGAPALSGGIYQFQDAYTLDLDLIGGHTYEVYFQSDCSAQLLGVVAYSLGSGAYCDAAHSSYWNGLTNITDASGAAIPGFNVTSLSGFNYLYADPSAPFPASSPPTGVPEPSGWMLLIAGLGLMGAMLRSPRERGAQG